MNNNDNTFEYFYERIVQWHKVAVDESAWGSEESQELYWKLLKEEFAELEDGFNTQNLVETLDGLCDVFVVLTYLVEVNVDLIVESEYTVSGMVPVRKFINICKPIITNKDKTKLPYMMSLLTKCMDYCNLPVHDGMYEVASSNDSKFPTVVEVKAVYGDDIEEAMKAASDWIESQGRYKGVCGVVKNGRCVFKDENGKVVKWTGFREANLKQLFHPEELVTDV